MIAYPIYIGDTSLEKLSESLQQGSWSKILVLVDENTFEHCYPILKPHLPLHYLSKVPAGETHKNLGTCMYVWQQITEAAFDRKALVINLGGGVVGDMGGFIAGTYKRGIDFIQIPTTLLAQVDASVGGKLGVDFQGYKNHIGLFKEPLGVYIYPPFLKSLPKRELLSGFAEAIKHHLIADQAAWSELKLKESLSQQDLAQLIAHSVKIKSDIVAADPFEKGARKGLNFGHTIGHALESRRLSSEQPLLHGEAIAVGMICEAWISMQRGLLSEESLHEIVQFFKKYYQNVVISAEEIEPICHLALNDKKNEGTRILCTLLEGIGHYKVNEEISRDDIKAAVQYYQKLT